MKNPGKHGRKDAKTKAPQPHHQQAAGGAPGRNEQRQSAPGHSSGRHNEQHRSGSSPSRSSTDSED